MSNSADQTNAHYAPLQPIRHAQFGNLQLPVNRPTRFLHRVLRKNGVIALGVQTARRAP
jgi:hypothetical protein